MNTDWVHSTCLVSLPANLLKRNARKTTPQNVGLDTIVSKNQNSTNRCFEQLLKDSWTNRKRKHLRWLSSSTSRTCWYARRVVDCIYDRKPAAVNRLMLASSGEERGGHKRTGGAEGEGITLTERRNGHKVISKGNQQQQE